MRALLIVALLVAAPLGVHAETASDALSRCLADNTSGKDRTALMRWMFLAMAVHPGIKDYAMADAFQAREQADKAVAALITRLLTESCAAETKTASKQGNKTIEEAFQTFGALAMQEIMSNPDVRAAVEGFAKHLDHSKLDQVVQGK